MNIKPADYQFAAIAKLNEGMASNKRDIVLKSCTGSGKTVILTHFMSEYCRSHADIVFVWLTPGKGNLEEQSKAKMDKHIHGTQTKLLHEVMASGFEANDCCFINWEKLTKKGNNALKDGERTNFIEHIEKALDSGVTFVIIVDESHQNDTIKATEIIDYFKTDKIIRSSATPKGNTDVFMVEVPETDVIAEGLIKKLLIINENFSQNIEVSDQVEFLLDKAITKQRELRSAFSQRDADVNPLILIQLPNSSDLLLSQVETYLEGKGITYENNQLAVWLANKKQNDEGVDKPNSEPVAIIIKQAIATGWDCPRAQILVKLRDNMSETFEIQTIGRIRRMPEQKHYESDLLDSCYLYTLDEKFTESVKQYFEMDALDALKLNIKAEYRDFTIISEYKTDVPFPRDAALALKILASHFETKYSAKPQNVGNKTRIQTGGGYVFSVLVVDETKSGSVSTLSREQFSALNTININQKLDTHKHGREYHHCAAEIGLKLTLEYSTINTILQRLFCVNNDCPLKIIPLSVREFYAFVINNKERLKQELFEAMSANNGNQFQLNLNQRITEKPVAFPQEYLFTYDSKAKSQDVLSKSVYRGYLVSAEVRSASEKLFEKFCETSNRILWFYKNGDKGPEYFSIVFTDNLGKQKSFYPDYIVGTNDGSIWIIETKGGFSKTGESEDIDRFTSKKFDVLKAYVDKYTAMNIKGGIVRQDKQSFELCICFDLYSDDIKSVNWNLLRDVL
jgi:type III restriction enzyme